MMDSRTHRRRASVRYGKDENGASPSLLTLVMKYLADRLARTAMQRLKRGAREAARWTILGLIMGWTGAALMAGGILLLLGAGVMGLEALHCPRWLACLSTGVLALLVALVAMKGILRPREEEEND